MADDAVRDCQPLACFYHFAELLAQEANVFMCTLVGASIGCRVEPLLGPHFGVLHCWRAFGAESSEKGRGWMW
jgi:hypothetical protein